VRCPSQGFLFSSLVLMQLLRLLRQREHRKHHDVIRDRLGRHLITAPEKYLRRKKKEYDDGP